MLKSFLIYFVYKVHHTRIYFDLKALIMNAIHYVFQVREKKFC